LVVYVDVKPSSRGHLASFRLFRILRKACFLRISAYILLVLKICVHELAFASGRQDTYCPDLGGPGPFQRALSFPAGGTATLLNSVDNLDNLADLITYFCKARFWGSCL
jgi:hypothetical protein